MAKRFNVAGACNSKFNYMVNIDGKLEQIKKMIDRGDYFTINRARQYGKTTILGALERMLRSDYIVVHLDFQAIGSADFVSEQSFVAAFAKRLVWAVEKDCRVKEEVLSSIGQFAHMQGGQARLSELFPCIKKWCGISEYPVVLMIDEVDAVSDNQIFLDFLGQLRAGFIARQLREEPMFLSVVLAGVYDIRNLKDKIKLAAKAEQGENAFSGGHKTNSPWNIASDFRVDMSLEETGIAGMLEEYEKDHHTGMDVRKMAELIYEYTSGYPYLVSRICNIIDEQISPGRVCRNPGNAWTKDGFLEAVRIILNERSTLFDSLINKLQDYLELRAKIFEMLFKGEDIVYNPDSEVLQIAEMFGFIENRKGMAVIANRIFEIRLYNYFLAVREAEQTDIYKAALAEKNQFIVGGQLNMRFVLDEFVRCFNEVYGDRNEKFLEEEGRRYFLLFLRPIINGTGNYYIESQTRNARRTDVIVDYHGKQFVIELKIWKGDAYNNRGEEQLSQYLDYYHLQEGYMISFNFNKNKQTGVREISVGDKVLIEAVV